MQMMFRSLASIHVLAGAIAIGPFVALAGAAPTLTTLATFNGTNGRNPQGLLVRDASGTLFGTTANGLGWGTVFKLPSGTSAPETLAAFDFAGGHLPRSGVIADGAGNLYGTTTATGNVNFGTVFRLAPGASTIDTLATFNGTNGQVSYVDASGAVYGTTFGGGSSGLGTLFKIESNSNALTTLVSFDGTNGSVPTGPLTPDGSGSLFGTTTQGGTSSAGTVFKFDLQTGAFSTLASFSGANGSRPTSRLLVTSSGDVYGAAARGGSADAGTVFKLPSGASDIQLLASFAAIFGSGPEGDLAIDAAGNLYGTTIHGTSSSARFGMVYRLEAGTNVLSSLFKFSGTDGEMPYSGVIADAAGNLFGTTYRGSGTATDGTIFKLSDTGFVVPEPAAIAGVVTAGLLVLRRVRRR